MIIQQARRLQTAVKEQANQRERLIAAANPGEIVAAADAYIAATDRCFDVACEIKDSEATG